MTDAVVFDWHATLAAPNADDFWPRIPELIVQAGGVVDPVAFRAWNAHQAVHVEHSTDEATYRRWERSRMAELLTRCAIDEPARTQLIEHIEDERYGRGISVFDGVPEVLDELRARGLVVGICSNWDWDLDRHLRANDIDHRLDFVICSAVLGRRKPHPSIFDEVVRLAGVPAASITFVGDNWDYDVEASTAAGMRAIHVSTGDPCADRDHGPVPCLDDLRELPALLDVISPRA
jgi:putative hydrolase of the HAD superfamily